MKLRVKQLILFIGDLAIFYTSLLIVLGFRYPDVSLSFLWATHYVAFTYVFILWVIIFYIAGLYEPTRLLPNQEVYELLYRTLVICGIVAILLFYTLPTFGIAPKTNLLLDLLLTSLLLTGWRWLCGIVMGRTQGMRILVVGEGNEIQDLIQYLNAHPQIGYKVLSANGAHAHELLKNIQHEHIAMVIAPSNYHEQRDLVQIIYSALPHGIRFVDFPTFYERIFGKVPVSLISETWFLENLSETEKRWFEFIKRTFDIIIGMMLGLVVVLITPFIGILIKLDSPGPIFLYNRRVGQQGKVFSLYKFRTMVVDAEKNGPQWTQYNDPRITRVGKWLRLTRIDELPQIWNVLQGDISFIGPRPEQPEFVEELKQAIPFYDMRHLIRPGLSGWAQINPPYYYSGVEDTILKLQYDLFYIKNRGPLTDITIALKTIAVLFSRLGR